MPHRNISQEPQVATIRGEECVGCTKCIKVCPVDAIVGARRIVHTVISDKCTGCKRCLKVCPRDCIDIDIATGKGYSPKIAITRDHECLERLNKEQQESCVGKELTEVQAKKEYIKEAILRVKKKRLEQNR